MAEEAALEYFRQPCVEQIDPRCLVGEPVSKVRLRLMHCLARLPFHSDYSPSLNTLLLSNPIPRQLFDYMTMTESEFYEFEMPWSMTPTVTQEVGRVGQRRGLNIRTS